MRFLPGPLKKFINENLTSWWWKLAFYKRCEARKELIKESRKFKVPTLTDRLEWVKSRKKSDTLFIFGNGSSIARYTDSDWKEIARHDVALVNDGISMPITPQYFFVEAGCKDSLIFNIHKKGEELRETAILYRMDEIFKYFYKQIPRFLRPQVIPYSAIVPSYLTHQHLDYFYDRVSASGIDQKVFYEGLVIDSFGSIVRALNFGIVMGYKELVLCGVDLKSGEYFFDLMKDSLQKNGFMIPVNSVSNQSQVHNTVDKTRRSITADDVMYAIAGKLAPSRNVKVSVYREDTLLFPKIPLYERNWKSV